MNGELRLCVNMRRSFAEIIRLYGKYPSTPDIKQAFHPIEIHPDTRHKQVYSSVRVVQIQRFIFGISRALEVFQSMISTASLRWCHKPY